MANQEGVRETDLTVKDLIGLLAKFNPQDRLLVSSDEEGNSLHPMFDIVPTDIAEEGEDEDMRLVIYPLNSSRDIT